MKSSIRRPEIGPNTKHATFILTPSKSTKQIHTQVCNAIIRSDNSNLQQSSRYVYDKNITRTMSRQIDKGISQNHVLSQAKKAEKLESEMENKNIENLYKKAGVSLAIDNDVEEVKTPMTDNQILATIAQKYNLPLIKSQLGVNIDNRKLAK